MCVEEWLASLAICLFGINAKASANRMALAHIARAFNHHIGWIKLSGDRSRADTAMSAARRPAIRFDDDLPVGRPRFRHSGCYHEKARLVRPGFLLEIVILCWFPVLRPITLAFVVEGFGSPKNGTHVASLIGPSHGEVPCFNCVHKFVPR